MGVVVIKRALDLAKEHELDLVEIAPTAKPPVCRIMDYSKFKYDQEKKERKVKKKHHVTHLKEIRLRPRIGVGDYQIKMKKAAEFLEKKDKVKFRMMFRGREITHRELGREILERAIKDLAACGQPDSGPSMEGRSMFVLMNPLASKV